MLRQPLRTIRRAPFFSVVVVLLLVLGIGANSLIFTAVDVLLWRPLPVAHPEQLVRFGVVRSSTHTTYDHAYVYARVLRRQATMEQEVATSLCRSGCWRRSRRFSRCLPRWSPGLDCSACSRYMVSRRTREMGIRVAVGATVSRIVRLVGGEAARAVAPGLAIGLAGYAFSSRALGALVYGVTRWDALSLTGAVLGLLAVALLAAFPPAVRAARVEPSIALREE